MDTSTTTTSPPSSETASLAARLKQETRELHHWAERSGVMAELLHRRIGRAAYAALLRELLAIYHALEAGLEAHAAEPNVRRLWRPELARRAALASDLAHLAPGLREDDPALASTVAGQAYVKRLHTLGADTPWLLLAHAYVRYLGDLHGGQVLGRLVREHFGLPSPAGTAFYELGEPTHLEFLRREFRVGLDALVLTPAQQDTFVAEACDAFRLHQQLFEELQRNALPN